MPYKGVLNLFVHPSLVTACKYIPCYNVWRVCGPGLFASQWGWLRRFVGLRDYGPDLLTSIILCNLHLTFDSLRCTDCSTRFVVWLVALPKLTFLFGLDLYQEESRD